MDKMIFNSSLPLVFMEISTQNNEEPNLIQFSDAEMAFLKKGVL